MAAKQRPSFLKRQKELQRVARATQKREERRLRKRSSGTLVEGEGEGDSALDALSAEESDLATDAGEPAEAEGPGDPA